MKESKKVIAERLRNEMDYFSGTEHYYNSWIHKFKYTDGIKAFCEKAKAFWFLDLVNSLFFNQRLRKRMNNDLIVIKLKVEENNTCVVSFKDSEKVFYEQAIQFTDCPIGEWVFYYDNGVLMWNEEY